MCGIGAPIAAANSPQGCFLDYPSGESVNAGSAVRPQGVRSALFCCYGGADGPDRMPGGPGHNGRKLSGLLLVGQIRANERDNLAIPGQNFR